MNRDHEKPETVFDMVADMEPGIIHVDGWAKAFQAVASSNERIDPAALAVMASSLEELGDRLAYKFRRLFDMAAKLEADQRVVP